MPEHTPSEQAGRLLAVLEDGCRHFTLMPGRAASYALDVSTVFGIPLHWTSIQTARPPIKDCLHRGHACKGVAIVSDRIPNLPMPPRRLGFDFFFIIIDCRPLLMGFEQWPVYDMFCSHSELIEHLSTFLPDDHQVQLDGATIEGDRLIVSRGSVLVAQYVPVTPFSWEPEGRRLDASQTLAESVEEAGHGRLDQRREPGESSSRDVLAPASSRSRSPWRSSASGPADVPASSKGETPFTSHDHGTLSAPVPVWSEVLTVFAVAVGATVPLCFHLGAFVEGLLRCLYVWFIQLSAVMCRPRSKAHADLAGSAVCTSADVGGDDVDTLQGLQGHEGLRCRVRQCRLLTEPEGSGAAHRATMDNLRFLAEELGGEWPYFEPHGVPGARPFVLHDPAAPLAAMPGVTRWIKVVILKPLFVPEEVNVLVTFPALFTDVKVAVQAARDPDIGNRFPLLWEASPQTVEGICVLLAGPAWATVANVVCVDARAWDGRIYAGLFPDYVDRTSALQAADIFPGARADVFFGWDQDPILEGVQLQVYPALTRHIRPFYAIDMPIWSLADRLISGAGWNDTATFPVPPIDDHYVLVMRGGYRIFQADPRRPAFYRRLLAEAAGVAEPEFVLVAAAPRVADASIDGRPCRTVLAGLSRSLFPDGAFCIFIDCRAIHRGWLCMSVRQGRIPIEAVKEVIDDDGPPGWMTAVLGAPTEHEVFAVEPGSVLLAVHVPVEVVAEPGIEWGEADLEALSAFHDWLDDFMRVEREDFGVTELPDPTSAPHAESEPSTERFALQDVIDAAFVVLAYDYAPELYHVQLPCPATLPQAIASVQELRPPQQCSWFPRLLEVFPQPDTSFGTLLAAPRWAAGGVLAVIDCRLIDDRLFCAVLPPRVDRESVLAVADLGSTAECEVYVRDEPWPLDVGGVTEVREGDLFLIADYSPGPFVAASLPDMLRSSAGWEVDPALFGFATERVWLVTEHEPLGLQVDRSRRHELRGRIADAVGVDETDLLLRQARPRIWDHWSDGRVSKAVLLAVAMRRAGTLVRSAVCILDMRPVLLGFQSAVFENGLVDTRALAGRLQQWRPEGFRVEIVGGQAGIALPPGWREVSDGDILRLELLPVGVPLHGGAVTLDTQDEDGEAVRECRGP